MVGGNQLAGELAVSGTAGEGWGFFPSFHKLCSESKPQEKIIAVSRIWM